MQAVDFGRQTGRESGNSDEEEDERREGDVLVLHPEKGNEYLKKHRGVPDMAKQTERPDFTSSSSDFTGDERAQGELNYASLEKHVPQVEMSLTTGRKDSGSRHDGTGECICKVDWCRRCLHVDPECPLASSRDILGPGTYNPDDGATQPRGYHAFISPDRQVVSPILCFCVVNIRPCAPRAM